MLLPLCEICQTQEAAVWVYFQHQHKTAQHQLCLECAQQITAEGLAEVFHQTPIDFSALKAALHHLDELPQEVSEDYPTLQKLQAMLGDDDDDELDQLFTNLLSDDGATPEKAPLATTENVHELQCPGCQTSWKTIHEDGLAGCPQCYVTFGAELRSALEELHQCSHHIGKTPRFRQKQEHLRQTHEKRQQHRHEMLQTRLEAAVTEERYEEAARIRDKITQLQVATPKAA